MLQSLPKLESQPQLPPNFIVPSSSMKLEVTENFTFGSNSQLISPDSPNSDSNHLYDRPYLKFFVQKGKLEKKLLISSQLTITFLD